MHNKFSYSASKNKGGLPSLNDTSNSMMSPVTGEPISFEEVIIPSHKVMESIYKCRFNKRNPDLLTIYSVMDILPGIRRTGRNVSPVIACMGENGKYEIISGLRRSYCVSISPDASLVVHVAQGLTDEEKKLLANLSDVYKKPSIIDFASTLKEFKKENAETFTTRMAAEVFGVSSAYISEADRVGDLPIEFFGLFPDQSLIGRNFLKNVIKFNIDAITQCITEIDAFNETIDENNENFDELIKQSTKQIEQSVIDFLKATKVRKQKSTSKLSKNQATWTEGVFKKGVIVRPSLKGAVQVLLSKEFLDSPEGLEVLKKLGAENSVN